MDYTKELKRLQEGSIYWKPKSSQIPYKIKALSEIEDTDPFIKKRSDGTEEINRQYKLKILVDGSEKTWTFGEGNTMASTQAQLVHLATTKGNKLTGVEFSVVVKSDGTKNDYTIVA